MTNRLPNYSWIKFQIDALNDADFMSLSDASAGIYLKMYLLAGRADAGGLLCDGRKVFTLNDLAWQLRIDEDILKNAFSELIETGFLARDGDGYKIVRFLEEQGPGDNAERNKWRERQQKHRSNFFQNPQEEELREDKDIDKRRGESHVTSQNVTVTSSEPPTPTLSSDFNSRIKITILKDLGNLDEGRLEKCLSFWGDLSAREGWLFENEKPILDLYSPGGLEERQKREAAKRTKREGRSWEEPLPSQASPEEYERLAAEVRQKRAELKVQEERATENSISG